MAWRRPGHKPLSEPMIVSLLTYMRHSACMSQKNREQNYQCVNKRMDEWDIYSINESIDWLIGERINWPVKLWTSIIFNE